MPSTPPVTPENTPDQLRDLPLRGVRIVVVEDMHLWRDLVAAVLATAGAEVVGSEESVGAATARVLEEQPDVVLLDLFLGKDDGLEVMRQAAKASPRTKWVVLTANARPYTLREALRLGVHGVLTKNGDKHSDLVRGVRQVANGAEFYSAAVSSVLAELVRNEKAVQLSPQEEQVMRRMAAGESMKEVAFAMGVETGTVAKYLHRVREKWGLNSTDPLVTVVEAGHRLGVLQRRSDG